MRRHLTSLALLSLWSLLLVGAIESSAGAAPQDSADHGFRFAKIFTDDMVLQQQKPIKVWGWTQPGEKVSVTLTQDREVGEKDAQETAADGDDAYSVTVQYVEKNPPKMATQSLDTTADSNGHWIVEFKPAKASFQPTWIIARSGDDTIAVQNLLVGEIWVCAGQSNMGWGNFNRKDREAASADFPGLRYVAWEDSWYKPLDDVRNSIQWQECSPESAQKFSAVPYLYGMYLHRYLKTPVGIINVARGGTTGQTWCLRDELDEIDHVTVATALKQYDAETTTWDDPKQVERIMAEWRTVVEDAKIEHAKKAAQAKADGKPEPRLRLPKQPGDPRSGWSPPAGLFNATVLPIKDLAVRGVLYYQGENNNFMRWTRYEYTFPKIPVSFRQAFGDEKLPFGCISQPGWGTFGVDPEVATVADGYAIVRDIQRRALAGDPHAGMIATYPTGNSYIHPAEKLPVAEYASRWALAEVYDKPVVRSGNTYREMKNGDDKIYLYFDVDPVVAERWKHVTDPAYWMVLPCPRQGKAPFEGFIIAGADRRWYPARAKHTKLDGKWSIEVWSDLVEEPVAVRYGWAQWPTGNLVGRDRLPMPTFRTDDWPLPEGTSYSPEAKQRSSEIIGKLKEEGQRQALDRKIRQMLIDLPRLEKELHLGKKDRSLKKLVESKIARIESALDEFQQDEWLARQIEGNHPDLAEQLKSTQETVKQLRAQAAAIEESK